MNKKGKTLFLLGLLFLLSAAGLTVYNLRIAQRAAQDADSALEKLQPQIEAAAEVAAKLPKEIRPAPEEEKIEYPDYILNPNMEMPVVEIDGREYVGVLSIPSLELELPVFDQWDYNKLLIAPGRYCGTVYRGDMVICAHNYPKHFGKIKNLGYGDAVSFTDADGNVFSYTVAEVVTLQPTAVDEMRSGDWDLTLFTCTVGGATRVTVRCVLDEPEY